MAKKHRQERAARPARQLEIPYKRPADFRYIWADGALVRIQAGTVVIGFYIDDSRVVSQSGELIETQGNVAVYRAGAMKEEMSRWEQLSVRISIGDAAALASLLQTKVQEAQTGQVDQAKSGEAPTGDE
jgi:hypothetical protein